MIDRNLLKGLANFLAIERTSEQNDNFDIVILFKLVRPLLLSDLEKYNFATYFEFKTILFKE